MNPFFHRTCPKAPVVRLFAGGLWVASCLGGWSAPTDILLDSVEIKEGSPPGARVGWLSAVDENPDETHVFSFVDGEGSKNNYGFRILGTELVSYYGVEHDYESGPLLLPVRIKVTNSLGEAYEKAFVLSVSDDRSEDFDGDGLTEEQEEDVHGTSDLVFDSDGDGVGDGAEIFGGSSPLNPGDWPDSAPMGWGNVASRALSLMVGQQFVDLVTGQNHSMALKAGGDVLAWGGRRSSSQIQVPADLGAVVGMAAGGDDWTPDTSYSVVVREDGTTRAWGFDHGGLVVMPAGLDDVVSVSAGRKHCLALKEDGTLVTWGYSLHGSIQPPAGLSGVIRIAAGGFHSLALKSDGTVAGWGSSFDGVSWGEFRVPAGLSDVVAVAAGRFHSLALRQDGTVVGWGYNLNGQASVPEGLTDVIAIAAGGFHSMALKSDGSVVCWGLNSNGQAPEIAPPAARSGVKLISAGLLHSLALRQVEGFPEIASGFRIEAGPGEVVEHQVVVANAVPTEFRANGLPSGLVIDAQTGLISGAVAEPVRQSVLVRAFTDKGVLTQTMWVGISEGEAATGIALTPAQVTENSADGTEIGVFTAVDPDEGDSHVFELVDGPGGRSNGRFRIEGNKLLVHQQLARDFEQSSEPFSIRVRARDASLNPYEQVILIQLLNDDTEDVDGDGLTEAEELLLGSSDLLYDSDGDGFGDAFEVRNGTSPVDALIFPAGRMLVGWGANGSGQTLVPAQSQAASVVGVAAGGSHGLAVSADGSILCWGDDSQGQATPPEGLGLVAEVAAGDAHSIARMRDGTVVAWGADDEGQCQVPPGLEDVVAVAAGGGHNLALTGAGTVVGWGLNDSGQAAVPPGLAVAVAIAAGSSHSLALLQDGSVAGWGDYDGVTVEIPAELMGVVAIAAGADHALALRYDGTVVAWGRNDAGQAQVPEGLSDVVGITAGNRHSVALRRDGSLVVWGDDSYQQASPPIEAVQIRRAGAGGFFNVAIRQDEGFPTFADDSLVRSWPGELVSRAVPLSGAVASSFRALGLPSGLSIDPVTGLIGGTVLAGEVRMARVMAETDQGSMSQILLFDTSEGVPPTNILLSGSSVLENSAAGTVVGDLTVEDPNIGDSHALELVSAPQVPDGYRFAIVGGQLILSGNLNADHDTGQTSLTIRIAATDLGDNRIERDFVIEVIDDRTEDADGDGIREAFEEDVLGTSDLVPDDLRTADPDGDGTPSIVEYAFNLDPKTAGPALALDPGGESSAGLPSVTLVAAEEGGHRLRIEYLRRLGSGLIYTPQFTDLLNPDGWQDAPNASIIVTGAGEGWERCVVEDQIISPSATRRFGRVAVNWSEWLSQE